MEGVYDSLVGVFAIAKLEMLRRMHGTCTLTRRRISSSMNIAPVICVGMYTHILSPVGLSVPELRESLCLYNLSACVVESPVSCFVWQGCFCKADLCFGPHTYMHDEAKRANVIRCGDGFFRVLLALARNEKLPAARQPKARA